MRTLSAAVAALAALGACAPSGQQPGQPVPTHTSTVRVTNQNWSDMTVYVVQNGSRVRLGMVTSMSTSTFRLPAAASRGVASVRIVADPIGSNRGFTSDALQVYPGQQVALMVQNSLQMSTVAVWDRR